MKNYTLNEIVVCPNPFDSVASIEMKFEKEQKVSIELMVSDGTIVKKLFKGEVAPDCTYHYDLDGSEMSSGRYFLKVLTPDHLDFHKIDLIRD